MALSKTAGNDFVRVGKDFILSHVGYLKKKNQLN